MGAFESIYAGASGRWLFARNWGAGFVGTYLNNKDVTPSGLLSTEGGHSILGTISASAPTQPAMEYGIWLHPSRSDL